MENALYSSQNFTRTMIRRETVFLIIVGIFLSTLTMMNILGISRFIDLSFKCFGNTIPLVIPVGILPYPITFLCTDLISEFYGAKRANWVVLVGLLANIWVFSVLWLSGNLPITPELDPQSKLPALEHADFAFFQIRLYALASIISSMIAYVCAQLLDIYLFHWLRNFTRGKHLWIRNNLSTMVSQLLDTVIVVFTSFWLVRSFPVGGGVASLGIIIMSSYLFKFCAAIVDTIPFYILVGTLKKYLEIDPDASDSVILHSNGSA